jgi:hypothetical protein
MRGLSTRDRVLGLAAQRDPDAVVELLRTLVRNGHFKRGRNEMKLQEENALIRQIAYRAEMMFTRRGTKVSYTFIESEVSLVHHEICRLRLKELLEADEWNFAHDIVGIHDHIDILDGSFRNGFSPRYAA